MTPTRPTAVPAAYSIRREQRRPRVAPHCARVLRDTVRAGLMLALADLVLFAAQVAAAPRTPNILFIIMDDVGIDQMQVMGYGGDTPPATPNLNTLARGGVRFHDTWSMPACSTSRSVFFTGRYPFRTNVFDALGPADLANSQVSPFERGMTRSCGSWSP